jgi:hypothetical protein
MAIVDTIWGPPHGGLRPRSYCSHLYDLDQRDFPTPPRRSRRRCRLGNRLWSGQSWLIMTTYALYTGWPKDAVSGPYQYRESNLTMIGILCLSILSSVVMAVLLKIVGNPPRDKIHSSGSSVSEPDRFQGGAAKREQQQRGFGRMWWSKWSN